MDVLVQLQRKCFVVTLIFQGLLLVVAKNVTEINICHQQNQTTSDQLHIKSPGFPNALTGHIKCKCDIEGKDIAIATRTLVLNGFESSSVLKILYNEHGNSSSWPQDNSETRFDTVNWKMVIGTGASKIQLSIDTSATESPEKMLSLFMFDFQASEDMFVSCQNLSSPDTIDDNDARDTTLLERIGSVCSPHVVIILGSLSCALLLIILIISIILCCVFPRRRGGYTIDYRNQQVTDEKKLKKAAKNDRESIIYDEAKVNLRASAAYNNTMYSQNNQPSYSNTGSQLLQRSNTVPAPCTRQSAQYVNTLAT